MLVDLHAQLFCQSGSASYLILDYLCYLFADHQLFEG